MMDCKRALEASDGDFDKAVIWLREKGIAAAAKKATSVNVNSTCLFVAHQPKLPENAKKLRKF